MTPNANVANLLQQGHDQLDRGEYQAGLQTFYQAAELEPQNSQLLYGLGLACYRLEQYQESVEYLNQALETKPNYILALARRGLAYQQLKQAQQAQTDFEQAIALTPQDADDWLGRGIALNELQRFDDAIASYDKAIEFKPDKHQAWYNRGNALGNLGRFDDAIASYDKAIEFKPDKHQAWYNRGIALGNLGRFDDAIASYDKAIEFKPDKHEAWYNRGNALGNLGRFDDAIASYDKAIEFKPDYHEAWYNRGNALGNLGRFDDAIASYDKAIEFKPDLHEAWYNRGIALGNLGRFDDAIASYDKAIEFKPDKHQAWNNRGNALGNLGRFDDAIASYDKAIEFKPDYHEAWNNRGIALGNLGRFDDAIASYDKAIEFKPDKHEAWNNRGNALGNLGRFDDAIASYDKAIEFKPDYHQAWYNRGIIALFDLGRFEEAHFAFDHAIEIKPDYHPALINQGNALVKLGRNTKAIEFYHRGLKSIDPQWWEAWNKNRGLPNIYTQNNKVAVKTSDNGINTLHIQTPDDQEDGSELNPEQWENLQDYIMQQPSLFPDLSDAKKSYGEALKFLIFDQFPEEHLQILQELLKVYSRDDTGKFNTKLEEGTQLLERLVSSRQSETEKITLDSKFAAFNQMRVDILAQSLATEKHIEALETAEIRKNTCLAWLREGSDYQPYTGFNFKQMQEKLLNPKTAAIYWHLSPIAITTFIIKHNQPLKILQPQLPSELQQKNYQPHFYQIQRFEAWMQQWKKSYQDYCQDGNTDKVKETAPWRLNMKTMLQNLSDILEIKQIEENLQDVDNLILIPHRELHLLPLDYLFDRRFIITYVPSFHIGLQLLESASSGQNADSTKLLNVEIPFNNLPFANIQSAALCCLYPEYGKLREPPVTKINLIEALGKYEGYFHFTGHGYHMLEKPRESALVLAELDKLTLGDIFEFRELDLGKYQLICLSACETGITSQETSKERIVDEYVGLVSGFLAKGANYVVSTLWRVDERSTALLMIKFYELLKTETPAVALKKAKDWLCKLTNEDLANWYDDWFQNLRNLPEDKCSHFLKTQARITKESKDCPFEHPYHWAGFILTGKPAFSLA